MTNLQLTVLNLLYMLPGVIIGITFHEYAHAKTADMLGDKTPRFQGRLTLNPIAHIDPMGLLMMVFIHFGWGKPVQINKRAFKNMYKDDLKVSLAGPIANLVVAFVALIVYQGMLLTVSTSVNTFIIATMIGYIAVININLFLFNLLPIPGLDGFHILEDLNPRVFYKWAQKVYDYQMFILIGFVLFGGTLLVGPSNAIYNFLSKIVSIILGIFI